MRVSAHDQGLGWEGETGAHGCLLPVALSRRRTAHRGGLGQGSPQVGLRLRLPGQWPLLGEVFNTSITCDWGSLGSAGGYDHYRWYFYLTAPTLFSLKCQEVPSPAENGPPTTFS